MLSLDFKLMILVRTGNISQYPTLEIFNDSDFLSTYHFSSEQIPSETGFSLVYKMRVMVPLVNRNNKGSWTKFGVNIETMIYNA